MIINNNVNYNRPLQNNVKAQNVAAASRVAFSGETLVQEQNNVQQNNSAQNVSFLGFVSKAFGAVIDKVYENSTSSEVESSFDLIA
jgi:hypothetical protein